MSKEKRNNNGFSLDFLIMELKKSNFQCFINQNAIGLLASLSSGCRRDRVST